MALPYSGVSRLAGESRAVDDFFGRSVTSAGIRPLWWTNPEGAGEYLKVSPRRLAAPVPFEFARVVLPMTEGAASFLVFAPQHAYTDSVDASDLVGDPTVAASPLDESAKYFLVLVALCEPRLRHSSTMALPTMDQIVDRLRPLESCADLTRAALNYHIDYLACTKLRVKEPAADGCGQRLEWTRGVGVPGTAIRAGPR
jgi:hypothetical protein